MPVVLNTSSKIPIAGVCQTLVRDICGTLWCHDVENHKDPAKALEIGSVREGVHIRHSARILRGLPKIKFVFSGFCTTGTSFRYIFAPLVLGHAT